MNRRTVALGVALIVGTLGGSAWLYPALPDRIPIHWNIRGEVDGYGSKAWAAWFGPALIAGMLGLFAVLPWLSPKQYEIDTFRRTYNGIAGLILTMLAGLHALTLAAALRPDWSSGRLLVGGLMVFFALLGNVLGKVRRNFYVGVRTPWTLASERVWDDTHRLAAWMFVGCGLAGAAVALLGLPLAVAFVLLMVAVVVPVVYSFVHSKRLERRGEA